VLVKWVIILIVVLGAGIGASMPVSNAPAPQAETPETVPDTAGETVIERSGNGHFYVDATVNGALVRFIVDTGATSVGLTEEDARRAGIHVPPSEFEVIGAGASGPVRGKRVTLARVSVGGKDVRSIDGAVVQGLHVSLLGQSYLSRIGSVSMSGSRMVLR
jgi:aspartyl protease family protein